MSRKSVIYYLNTRWVPHDGGELLLYPPVAVGSDGSTAPSDAPAVGSIAPIGNRLLLFYADARVPHEVLPSRADRYAVTLWYYDVDEVRKASRGPQ